MKKAAMDSRPARWAVMMLAAVVAIGLVSPLWPQVADSSESTPASPLPTSAVVERLVAMTLQRHEALHSYTALRHYHLEYHGLGHDTADMDVRVEYTAPGPKRFTIVSQSGSGMLRHHVLDPLLGEEEKEARIEHAEGSVFVPENYSFTMVDYPRRGGQPDYVLAIQPRRDAHRFQFRGTIWIDPVTFGLVRAQGVSVRSPSWWVSKFEFTYQGQEIDGFWMPASNHCVSHLRLFGHATLDITYDHFRITSSAQPLSYVAGETAPEGR